MRAGDMVLLYSPRRGKSFLVQLEEGKRFHTHLGVVEAAEVMAAGPGGKVMTSKGEELLVIIPPLSEVVRRAPRRTQIVFPKDASYVVLNLDVRPGSRVLECGCGSGAMTAVLASLVGDEGKVYSYERREEFLELARSFVERLGLSSRVEFKLRDASEGFDERGLDAVFLDLPDPWNHMEAAVTSLAPGKAMGVLVPTFLQVERTLEAMRAFGLSYVRICEILLREIKPNPGRVRPEDRMVAHTGYLLFGHRVLGGVHPTEEVEAQEEEVSP